jgi:toxin ParE1/3/4
MIYWLRSARNDIADIFDYLQQFDDEAARRVVGQIYAAPNRLSRFPKSGTPRPDIHEDVRSIAVAPYVLIYRISLGHVEVIRVLHGARDLKAAFEGF